jgi:hypothetical protein
MPDVNPDILVWARETAGLTPEEAVRKLGINPSKNMTGAEKLRLWS